MTDTLAEGLGNVLDGLLFGDEMAFNTIAMLAGIVGELCIEAGRLDLSEKLSDHLTLSSEAFRQRNEP